MKRPGIACVAAVAVLAVALAARSSVAVVSTSEPAALLVFPLIIAGDGSGTDTLVQLTNVDETEVRIHCQYETVPGNAPPVRFTPFSIRLVGNQPIAWRAGRGLDLPEEGTDIPPLEPGFTGVLRCVATDADGGPAERNVLVGSATLESVAAPPAAAADSAQYSATGFDALAGALNRNDQLVLGGTNAEYAACPESVLLSSFLDGAILDLGGGAGMQQELSTRLAVVTCAQRTRSQVRFTLVTELGQQFTTVRFVEEQLVTRLSLIDTDVLSQSIFNVAMSGSPTGTIRLTPLSGSGVLAVAVREHADPNGVTSPHTAAVGARLSGERTEPDVVDVVRVTATATATPPVTPTPIVACVGDCDGDGMVAINELLIGVNITLGNQPLSACPSFDANSDGQVAINELIAAVGNALSGC